MIDLCDKKTIVCMLQSRGLRAKKYFSQNFLVNRGALNKIIAAADISPADSIIEIGCGLGTLTAELAPAARNVLVFEKDPQMISLAKQNLANFKNIAFIESDVLDIPPPNQPYKLVANIPYAIATMILTHFLLAKPPSRRPDIMILMLQKEVVEKICAKPPHMNLLAILTQVFGRPRKTASVPAGNFYPAPKVDSAILKIEMRSEPIIASEKTDKFFNLVRSAFSKKRKMLAPTLAKILKKPKAEIQNILTRLNISPFSRPENLSIEDWYRFCIDIF